jgi:hypothetical protein
MLYMHHIIHLTRVYLHHVFIMHCSSGTSRSHFEQCIYNMLALCHTHLNMLYMHHIIHLTRVYLHHVFIMHCSSGTSRSHFEQCIYNILALCHTHLNMLYNASYNTFNTCILASCIYHALLKWNIKKPF